MWRRPTTHKNNMPKTTNGLWAKLIDFDNLYQAFQEARHGKRYRLEVMRFASNLDLHMIYKTLILSMIERVFVGLSPV